MKETFEKIRNKKPEIFTLRVRLTLLVMAELTTVVLLAALLTELIHSVLKIEINIPVALELIVLSLIVGAAVTSLLGRMFFLPIKELSRAMEKVADGDFHVQLETRSTSKEIQEVYSGFNLMTQELRATEILQTDFVSNVSH